MAKLTKSQIKALAFGLPKPKYRKKEGFTVIQMKILENRREKKQNERKQNKQMEKFKELSIEEMQEGVWGWGLIGSALLLYISWYIAVNPCVTIATFKKGFQEGYESLK